MADDDIDIEGDFDLKLEVGNVYDTNELPSKSANLLPEFTNPAWMLEQGWSMDNYIDEKSKATIERMLQEEQYYLHGKSPGRSKGHNSVTQVKPLTHKQPWNEEEKQMFKRGMELFGRSWTKIAQLIPSRTTLQVKNYAQQYFKQKAKTQTNMTCKEEEEPRPGNSVDITKSSLAQALVSVTTGQPTVASGTRSLNNHKNQSRPRGEVRNNKHNDKSRPKTKSERPNQLQAAQYKEVSQPVTVVLNESNDLHGKQIKEEILEDGDAASPFSVQTPPSQLQLSPTLEDKLANSTGIIENLDTFCAVADIVTSSGRPSSSEEDSDIDIDIENDDEDDALQNPVLKNRSASPNSVYERLVQEANLRRKGNNRGSYSYKHLSEEDLSTELSNDCDESVKDSEINDPVESASESEINQEEKEEDFKSKPGSFDQLNDDSSEQEFQEQKRIVNGLVLYSGDIMEFPIPFEEVQIDSKIITAEEKKVHSEFFEGRPSKTPERYMKIRNYILDAWKKCKPKYLNKTSVRPGLKNCGDVNCIGRIHNYLECTGAINFGCDQVIYKNPTKIAPVIHKEKGGKENQTILSKLDTMRPRKRRIKDAFGHWIDEKELQGRTIEHKDQAVDIRVTKTKLPRTGRSSYDPFKLIPCVPFTDDSKAPFSVEIHNFSLVTMDMHAHVSKTEVIGLLGGHFVEEEEKLVITTAAPCNSVSTGMQCEMDPVSQTQACEMITSRDAVVVGWYHSHPTFGPNPSIRDIETQLKMQEYFSKGGQKFVGIIVSPYNRVNWGLCSEFQCLTISDVPCEIHQCNIPHCFAYEVVIQPIIQHEIEVLARDLAEKYSSYCNKVELLGKFRSSSNLLCLEKMMVSMKEFMDLSQSDLEDILTVVKDIFLEYYTSDTEMKPLGVVIEEAPNEDFILSDISHSQEPYSSDLLDTMVIQEVTIETEPSSQYDEESPYDEDDVDTEPKLTGNMAENINCDHVINAYS